jgi:hypothetical protein
MDKTYYERSRGVRFHSDESRPAYRLSFGNDVVHYGPTRASGGGVVYVEHAAMKITTGTNRANLSFIISLH